MARQDAQTEYIVTQDAYRIAYASLPQTGSEGEKAQSAKILAKQYRQNISKTVNADKWTLWAMPEESFEFTWQNGAWTPPKNLVVLGK